MKLLIIPWKRQIIYLILSAVSSALFLMMDTSISP